MSQPPTTLSYADAGVNIDSGNQLVEKIKTMAKSTHSPNVIGGIGGFASLFALPQGLVDPILVSCTDGVGTKLKLAIELDRHNTIGQDLVAMCVNDMAVCGATPLFFLDYFACSRLEDHAEAILQGITKGCELGGLALIGGETAEMPGLYASKDYDLAGFCVGVVEKAKIIDGSTIAAGDLVLGLPASGAHSNGYSLIRRVLDKHEISLQTAFEDTTLGDYLLTPTRIYTRSLLALAKAGFMKGAAHITGGGLLENIPRILPQHTQAIIHTQHWEQPRFFSWLQNQGPIETNEMWRTFNMGIGMAVIVEPHRAAEAMAILKAEGETPCLIGEIAQTDEKAPSIKLEMA